MKDENVQDLRVRTKEFALRIIRLNTSLPKTTEAQVIGKQGSALEHPLGRTTAKQVAQNRMPTSSTRSKTLCRNSTKPLTGSNCWLNPEL
jgi:hypothetical protein